MTTLIGTLTNRPARWQSGSAQADRSRHGTASIGTGAAGERAFLRAITAAAFDCGEPAFAQWRAELEFADSTRALPLAWPLDEWLDDYRALLATALVDPPA